MNENFLWIALLAVATLTDASRIFVDNYVSDVYFKGRASIAQKLFYAYAYLLFGIILIAVGGFNINLANLGPVLLLILSGVFASLASIPYYKALELDNSTNLGIFIQLAPILYLVFGWLFLGETISLFQILASLVILAAPLLIVLTAKKQSRGTRLRAVLYAFLYIFIAVLSNEIFVLENTGEINFLTSIGAVLLGKSLGSFLIMAIKPKWRRRYHQVMKKSHHRLLRPLSLNAIIVLVKDITYRAGLLAAPSVALASAASDAVEPLVIFFMGIILTLIAPKFGREKLDSKTVFVHIIATVLVVAGIILLQLPVEA